MLVEDSSVILGLEFREIQGVRHCNSMTIVYGSLSEEGTPLFGKKKCWKVSFPELQAQCMLYFEI